jgi:hypothetical protein
LPRPKARVVKARSWSELPEILEPGVAYEVDGVIIEPRVEMSRAEARALARGVREMARREP